ncbi:hypothetical protein ACJZ2D_004842 [Fusarium nematophilum]
MEVAASVIAIIQITGQVASACKSYIDAFQDYPKDLRLIYVETTSLKAVFEGLSFFDPNDPEDSAALQALKHQDGPIEGCRRAMEELNKMLPRALPQAATRKSKKRKLESSLVALAWPLKCERARKLLDEILVQKSTINTALTGQILHDVRVIKAGINQANQTLTEDSERRDVCNWFEIVNPSSNHNAATRLYVDGTGDWVSRAQPWIDWRNRQTRALWMHGIPGAGKTVLAAHLIKEVFEMCEETNDAKVACVYFYCYHGHNRDEAVPFLRWLLGQLFRKSGVVPERAYNVFKQNREPDLCLLKSILEESLLHFATVWIMVDALDESQSRENLLHLLQELIQDDRFRKLQLFATSREYLDIKQTMCAIAEPLSLSNHWVEADIKTYVAAMIKESRGFSRWPVELREQVEESLSKGAKGMFRWAVCQLDILRRLKTTDEIWEAITNLPVTLDETYERIFSCIDEYDRDLVRHTLQWLQFHNLAWYTDVRLTGPVLISAYRMGTEESTPQNSALVDLELLKESCGCLVTWSLCDEDSFSNNSGIEHATLAHYTVREFLESDRATRCSSFFRLQPGVPTQDVVNSVFSRAMNAKLLAVPDTFYEMTDLDDYCSTSALRSLWVFEKVIEPSLAFKFLDPSSSSFPRLEIDDSYYSIWSETSFNPSYTDWKTLITDSPAAKLSLQLFQAGCLEPWKECLRQYGIRTVLKSTLSVTISGLSVPPFYGDDDDGSREFQGTVLEYIIFTALSHEATEDQTERILSFIFNEGDHLGDIGCLVSYWVSRGWGAPDIFSQLLQAGACPDPEGFRVTPLQMACGLNQWEMVDLLLEAGADPNRTGDGDGVKWDTTSVLGRFDELHGLSSLRIVRTNPLGFNGHAGHPELVENLLLGYQARDFARKAAST